MNIEEAERLVDEVEGEGERGREEVEEAARKMEAAVTAIEEASQLALQALEVCVGHVTVM